MSAKTLSRGDRLRLIDENFEFVERRGMAYVQELEAELKALGLPSGSYVIINVLTGDYVTGSSRREAQIAYRVRHKGSPGWAARIEDIGNG